METGPFAPATENSTRCLEAALPFLRHSAPEECLFVWGWECPSAFFSSGVLTASYPSQELWLQQGCLKKEVPAKNASSSMSKQFSRSTALQREAIQPHHCSQATIHADFLPSAFPLSTLFLFFLIYLCY